MMRVPFVDLGRGRPSTREEIKRAIETVVEGGNFILGPEVLAFEKEFAAYCGREHGVGLSSGTDAIFLALKALGVGSGDEVITAANTYIATFNAISLCGATPVPVDVEPEFYNMDPDLVKAAITPRTRAIVPVHLFGQAADMDPILAVASETGIPVVEDSAQAHGARYKGRLCGSLGLIACFSFYPAKNLGCYGDGGAVVTADAGLAGEIELLRNYGQKEKNVHSIVGYNKRLDEVQAAVLRVKLRELDAGNESRRRCAARYRELLGGLEAVTPPAERGGDSTHVYHLFILRCEERDRLRDHLAERGVATGIHYPVPPHLQPAYADLGHVPGDFPVAEMLGREILSLPMFPGLAAQEIEYVCETMKGFYGS